MTELQEARQQATFPPNEMKVLLNGGEESLQRRQRVLEIVENDPIFSKAGRHHLSRKEVCG